MSNRSDEWVKFSAEVQDHIENYVIPQYNDAPDDIASQWSARDCLCKIEGYVKRQGKNSRRNNDRLDLIKIAHYACMAASKL